MFTDEDYEKYFDQIARVERKMIYGVYDLSREIDDPAVTRVLQKIGDDEVRHYGYVLKMLKMTLTPGRTENRRETREYCLGKIQLLKMQDQVGDVVHAYCVNLSKSGVCLESPTALLAEEYFELAIRLFDKDELISRRGRVLWCKEVEPGFYISGIVFEA